MGLLRACAYPSKTARVRATDKSCTYRVPWPSLDGMSSFSIEGVTEMDEDKAYQTLARAPQKPEALLGMDMVGKTD